MKALAVPGVLHIINRATIYDSVTKLYKKTRIYMEYPLEMEYAGEMAIDDGGVTRDMISGFWESAYHLLFDGATLLIPMCHPQMNMQDFKVIGCFLSHSYLVSGILPVRIALPTLMAMLLGPAVDITSSLLLETLLDYISPPERNMLKRALAYEGNEKFPSHLQQPLLDTLGNFGCHSLPTPSSLLSIIENVARCEFLVKPASSISLVNAGIPQEHRKFWEKLSPSTLYDIYTSLILTPEKVNSLLSIPCSMTLLQERTCNYLRTMVGNMNPGELRCFMRFVTGSSVCLDKSISVEFSNLSGFARRPIAHTCASTLELSVSFMNYDDFNADFKAILSETDDEFSWRMDAL